MTDVEYPSETAMTLAVTARVKQLRTDARLSGAALAEGMAKLGFRWNQSTVAKLESGRRRLISVDEVVALGVMLDVPPVLLLADPRQDTPVPVAEGIEVDPWSALLWLTGAGTLDNRPDGHAAYQYAADLIGEGRLVVEMAAKLRRRERFMAATEEEAQRRQDELHRNYLETMQRALEHIEEMGATVPRVGPHVLQRAAELGVKLPGQDGEG